MEQLKLFFRDKINLILSAVLFVLCLIFVFSFSGNRKSRKENIRTSLVNPRYVDEIDFFELKSGDSILDFKKQDGVWFCGNLTEDGNFFAPCIPGKAETFLKSLSDVKEYKKISGGKGNLSSYGISEEEGFFFRYEVSGNIFELCFGDKNFTETGRYLKSGNNENIFQTDISLDKYFYTSSGQWTDPYLISRAFGKYSFQDVQSKVPEDILELRHSGISFVAVPENSVPEKTLKVEMGDTSFYRFEFFENSESENSFLVSVTYENPLSKKLFEYSVKVSEWTYNKLK